MVAGGLEVKTVRLGHWIHLLGLALVRQWSVPPLCCGRGARLFHPVTLQSLPGMPRVWATRILDSLPPPQLGPWQFLYYAMGVVP